jgi:hypothetical protein
LNLKKKKKKKQQTKCFNEKKEEMFDAHYQYSFPPNSCMFFLPQNSRETRRSYFYLSSIIERLEEKI